MDEQILLVTAKDGFIMMMQDPQFIHASAFTSTNVVYPGMVGKYISKDIYVVPNEPKRCRVDILYHLLISLERGVSIESTEVRYVDYLITHKDDIKRQYIIEQI